MSVRRAQLVRNGQTVDVSDIDEAYRLFWNSLLVMPWEAEASPEPRLTVLLLADSLIQNGGLLNWLTDEAAPGESAALSAVCREFGLSELADLVDEGQHRVSGASDDELDELEDELDPRYATLSEGIDPAVRRWWEGHVWRRRAADGQPRTPSP